ncbi:MAG: GyrI-like domain-containing protein, partial [Candidatus Eremiobacteraeota bacterium]|nr:GyrI-like domain-containing protein [Candidatus Eremiobacteraeota bacterium]
VFMHRGHISTIRNTWNSIFTDSLPKSKLEVVKGADFERYTSAFDPRTGNGEVEIWIPINS